MTKEQYFEYLGIYKFWQVGYTGKGVKIMSGEYIEQDYKKTDAWRSIICPKGYKSDASHGSSVMSIMQEICPDAMFYSYPLDYGKNGSTCCNYIIENGINLFGTSNIISSVNKNLENEMQRCIDEGCTFFAAAGNDAERGVRGMSKSEKFIAIGICDFVKGKLQWVNPSSIGEELDYVMLPPYGRWTSWCSPTFTAMCGLVQDFFIVNAGKPLNREELIRFIDDNLIDIEEEGFDVKSGKGLFILPEPSTIDISKYVTDINVGDLKGDEEELQIITKYMTQNDCYKAGKPLTVKGLMLHSTATPGVMAADWYSRWNKSGIAKCVHAFVDDKGVWQYLPWIMRGWHCGGTGNNSYIGVEMCEPSNLNDKVYFTKVYENAVELFAQLCMQFQLTADNIICHCEGYKLGIASNHSDVMHWFPKHNKTMDDFRHDVAIRIEQKQKEMEEREMNEPSDWAKTAWEWGKANGICDGTNPKGTITREQVVQMLYNYIVKGAK